MNTKKSIFKRVCSVSLAVALLVGLLSVTGALPAAAAATTSVEKFTADFSNLAAGEVSTAANNAVTAYLTEKFNFYYAEESWMFGRPNVNDYWEKANDDGTYSPITEIGSVQASDTVYKPDTHTPYSGGWAHAIAGIGAADAASGISKWKVGEDGMLYCDANFASEPGYFHRFNQMTVLDANGDAAVLKNFELKMDVKLRKESRDHFMISFRAATEAAMRNFTDRAIFAMQEQMWMLGGKDDSYRGGNASQFANFANSDANADIDMPYDGAWSKLDLNKVYTIKLKAVNDKLTVEIYDGVTKLYAYEKQTSWTDEGYITIGGSNAGAYYGNIEITRLDDNGNAVDFTANPKKFIANFSKLAAGEVSTDANNAVTSYLTDKFNFYYAEESWSFGRPTVNNYWEKANGDGTYSPITEIGSVQAADTVYTPDTHTPYSGGWAHCLAGVGAADSATGISKWIVGEDGMLYCDANFDKDTTYFHRFNQMTVLDDNGDPAVLKNFELTMDVKLRKMKYDHFMISFRAQTEYAMRNFDNRAIFAMQEQMWMLGGKDDSYRGNNPSQFANFANSDANADIDMPYDGGWSKLDLNKVYTIKLKAVNDKLTVEIYDGATKLYSYEKQTSWTNEGYITIGGSNAGGYYGDIEITRLDDNGNAVDFTPKATHVCDYTIKKYDANNHWNECDCGEKANVEAHVFDNNCDTTCACGYVREITHNYATAKFDENNHWNECACGEKANVEAHVFDSDCDTTCACGYARVITHDYANAKFDENNHWNECACGEKADVEAHVFDNDCDTTCACGYTREITHNYATPKFDAENHWNECACGEKADVTPHTITDRHNEEGHWTACDCGYATAMNAHELGYVADGDQHYQTCACGYATEKEYHTFGEDNMCACGAQAPNSATVADRIITLNLEEGYELKAGSLIVYDKDGNAWVPQRVGYRDGGDGYQFEIPAGVEGPFTVDYKVIQPQGGIGEKDNAVNMGILGTQTTDPETYGGGLRFIHRLNITTEQDGKMYINYNGEKLEVAEYGLLLASQAVLKNPEDLDIETALESKHVKMYSWPERGVYFDKCSNYADVAVHVTNIAAAGGQNVNLITRTYVKLANGQVYYGKVVVESYAGANE